MSASRTDAETLYLKAIDLVDGVNDGTLDELVKLLFAAYMNHKNTFDITVELNYEVYEKMVALNKLREDNKKTAAPTVQTPAAPVLETQASTPIKDNASSPFRKAINIKTLQRVVRKAIKSCKRAGRKLKRAFITESVEVIY